METNKPSNRLHPLMAAAAVGVLLVSLTGVAAMTGLLPSSHGSPEPATVLSTPTSMNDTNTKTASNDIDATTLKSVPATNNQPVNRPATTSSYRQAQASQICHTCGRVESIQAVQQTAKPSGIGAVAGALVGGVLGNQVGAGNGRAISTVAGAVGGGFAGNAIERHTHTTTAYEVRVRMEDGHVRTFPQSSQNNWRVGDRVKVVNGSLTSEG
ncbi:MAG: glycine zipper 2TM domain-containing protein [Burkholderiaceae bacterium]